MQGEEGAHVVTVPLLCALRATSAVLHVTVSVLATQVIATDQ